MGITGGVVVGGVVGDGEEEVDVTTGVRGRSDGTRGPSLVPEA